MTPNRFAPIPVFLDTSALRQESGRRGKGLVRLAELSKRNLVTVIVPELVEREFVSGMAAHLAAVVQKEQRELKKAASWLGRAVARRRVISALRDLRRTAIRAQALVEKGFGGWLRRLNARRVPISEAQTKIAWDRYFSGAPPYKQLKNRPDLPDGFIFASVMVESQGNSLSHVVCGDQRLRDALAMIPKVAAHKSVSAFTTCKIVLDAVRQDEDRIPDPDRLHVTRRPLEHPRDSARSSAGQGTDAFEWASVEKFTITAPWHGVSG